MKKFLRNAILQRGLYNSYEHVCILVTYISLCIADTDVIFSYHIYSSYFPATMWGKLCVMFVIVTSLPKLGSDNTDIFLSQLITFRVSRRRREMYIGHARLCLCVCVSVCVCISLSLAAFSKYCKTQMYLGKW